MFGYALIMGRSGIVKSGDRLGFPGVRHAVNRTDPVDIQKVTSSKKMRQVGSGLDLMSVYHFRSWPLP